MLDEILKYNRGFVEKKRYAAYKADKYPCGKTVILSCMDTRLTHFLPDALGLRDGEVNLINNAGGIVLSLRDTTVRSLLISVLELGTEEILVVVHTDCGVRGMSPQKISDRLEERGISSETLARLEEQGIFSMKEWFTGFTDEKQAARDTVALLRSHPLLPKDVRIHGLTFDIKTGKLELICTA